MPDLKSLEVFRSVVDLGSFSQAAEARYLTHTAVIKRVNQLEAEVGARLLDRTNHGVSCTPAGDALYRDAGKILALWDSARRRAREAGVAAPVTLRLGSSLLYPCSAFLDLWERAGSRCPQFRIQMVTFQDGPLRLANLGRDYDFIVGAFDSAWAERGLSFTQLGSYGFRIALPRTDELASRSRVGLEELEGRQLMVMRTGASPANDALRGTIVKEHPAIEIVDIPSEYDIGTFNRCAEEGCALLSLECWDDVHPALASVPLEVDERLPYGIVAPATSGQVSWFAREIADALPQGRPS